MKRRLIEVIKGETGQALPVVLVLMLLGGLLIAPSLSYAATSLNAGQIVEKKVNGLYAADAGVEYALWYIVDGSEKLKDLKELPEYVNQLEVKIKADEEKDPYTIYYGELTETGDKYDYLDVGGEMGEWEEEVEAYPYTITVTWQAESGKPPINLEEIGVRLPVGYEYKPGSAATFFEGELFSNDEPVDPVEQDQAGAYMPKWEFTPPYPEVSEENPVATQTLYVTGAGEQSGDYACVGTHGHTSIGKVGEIAGKMYTIEAKAKVPKGEEIAKVKACVLKEGEEEEVVIYIISWQINP